MEGCWKQRRGNKIIRPKSYGSPRWHETNPIFVRSSPPERSVKIRLLAYITRVPESRGGRDYPTEFFFGGVVGRNFSIFGVGYYSSATFFPRGDWAKKAKKFARASAREIFPLFWPIPPRKKACGGVVSTPENSKILPYHPTEKKFGGVVPTPPTYGDLCDVWYRSG